MHSLYHLNEKEFILQLTMYEKEHLPPRKAHRDIEQFIREGFKQGMNYSGNIEIACERLAALYPKKYKHGVYVGLALLNEVLNTKIKTQSFSLSMNNIDGLKKLSRLSIEEFKPAAWSLFEVLIETNLTKFNDFNHPYLCKTKEDFLLYYKLKQTLPLHYTHSCKHKV